MTMLRHLRWSVLLVALAVLGSGAAVWPQPPGGVAHDANLQGRVMRIRSLLETARGVVSTQDYEQAARYDKQSLEALTRGDKAQALRLLDAGIALLAPAGAGARAIGLPPGEGAAPPPAAAGGFAAPAGPSDLGPSGGPPGGAPQAVVSSDIAARPAAPATRWNSPFGVHPASVPGPYPYAFANDMGVRWTREPLYIMWEAVQRDPSQASYDFTPFDRIMASAPPGMLFLWNLTTAPPDAMQRGSAHVAKGSYFPTRPEAYAAFVRATVARYGGKGAGGREPVKYWQVDNEPAPFKGSRYADLVRLTSQAVKAADPAAKVVLGGTAGFAPASDYIKGFDQVFRPYLHELRSGDFDVFDLHWFGDATGDYKGLGPVTAHVRQALVEAGFSPDTELWVTETGTYSGSPKAIGGLGNRTFGPQTEAQQAADLVRRHVYALRLGVRKIFWAYGLLEGFKHDGGFFDHTGVLRQDGGKKPAYYTYRLMTKFLEGAKLPPRVVLEEQDGANAYAFERPGGKTVVAAWSDAASPGWKAIPVAGRVARVTRAVTDAPGEVVSFTAPVVSGAVTVDLAQGPVFIEEQ